MVTTIELFLLEFLFYDLTLIGISMTSAGFCTYAPKVFSRDSLEIIFSASIVAGSVLSVQFVGNLIQASVAFGVVVCSVAWYLKQEVIRAVVIKNLLERFHSDTQIVAKLSLSRTFAIRSLSTLLLTLTISAMLAASNGRKTVCVVVLESGLLVNAWLQILHFMLRSHHHGERSSELKQSVSIRKVSLILEPIRSDLVLMTQRFL
jgi:hypothetical protein